MCAGEGKEMRRVKLRAPCHEEQKLREQRPAGILSYGLFLFLRRARAFFAFYSATN